MKHIKLRDVVGYLKQYPSIDTILFTGGNSKNGPEYFFRIHLKAHNLKLELIFNEVPRVHQFQLPIIARETQQSDKSNLPVTSLADETSLRSILTVSLTSSSGAANISISRMPLYLSLIHI